MLRLVFVGIFFCAQTMCLEQTVADFQSLLDRLDISTEDKTKFIAPNERRPYEMKPLIESAPEGLYIGLGSERTWFALGHGEKWRGAILIDQNPNVAIYNQINLALLRVSENFTDYLRLRTSSDHRLWLEKITPSSNMKALDRSALSDPRAFGFWRHCLLHEPILSSLDVVPISLQLTYLTDPEVFARLKNFVDQQPIEILTGDISRPSTLEKMAGSKTQMNAPVSVMDISNAWDRPYVAPEDVARIVMFFTEHSSAESILLTTQAGKRGRNWNYVGLERGILTHMLEYSLSLPPILSESLPWTYFTGTPYRAIGTGAYLFLTPEPISTCQTKLWLLGRRDLEKEKGAQIKHPQFLRSLP